MNLKKIFYFTLVFIIIFSLTSLVEAKKSTDSVWSPQPVKVDGNDIEWKDAVMQGKDKLKVEYSFKNDNNYLYIIFKFNDFQFLSSINSSGMTVWLNSNGKKKRRYGINFKRRMITPEAFIAIIEKRHGPLPEAKKQEIKQKKFYSIYQNGVVNKDTENPIPIQLSSALAPAFKVAQTREAMLYEFRVPLENVAGKITGIGTKPGEEIMIGFEWGGMTQEIKESMAKRRGNAGMSSYKSGVNESTPGSGWTGGSTSASTGGNTYAQFARTRAPKKYKLWVPLKLSVKQ